jgi:hypothetical protein
MGISEEDRGRVMDSIKHWERMRDNPYGADAPTITGCALCRAYHALDCFGCPIFSKTGSSLCGLTPFQDADDAYEDMQEHLSNWREKAQAEVDFLRSLLEE